MEEHYLNISQNIFYCVYLCSTPALVLRVQDRLWPLLVPVLRNSAVLHSSSVTDVEPATITPTPTAFGSPPLMIARCLRKKHMRVELPDLQRNTQRCWCLVSIQWCNFSPGHIHMFGFQMQQNTLTNIQPQPSE